MGPLVAVLMAAHSAKEVTYSENVVCMDCHHLILDLRGIAKLSAIHLVRKALGSRLESKLIADIVNGN